MPEGTLRVTSGPASGTTIDLHGDFTFGRDVSGAGALGGDPEMSRQHARITTGPSGEVLIEDLGSTNGTFVNGHRIADPTPIRPGDKIELGNSGFELTGLAAGAQVTKAGAAAVPPPPPQRPPRPAAPAAAAGATPLPTGMGSEHPATARKKGGSKVLPVLLGLILGLLVGGGIAAAALESDDDESAGSRRGRRGGVRRHAVHALQRLRTEVQEQRARVPHEQGQPAAAKPARVFDRRHRGAKPQPQPRDRRRAGDQLRRRAQAHVRRQPGIGHDRGLRRRVRRHAERCRRVAIRRPRASPRSRPVWPATRCSW